MHAYRLTVDNYDSFIFNLDKSTTIGRKDIGSKPDIDLGPYDKGPYLSRNQGYFYLKDEKLFYIDIGKNPVYRNGIIIEKNIETQIYDGDRLIFGKINTIISLSRE